MLSLLWWIFFFCCVVIKFISLIKVFGCLRWNIGNIFGSKFIFVDGIKLMVNCLFFWIIFCVCNLVFFVCLRIVSVFWRKYFFAVVNVILCLFFISNGILIQFLRLWIWLFNEGCEVCSFFVVWVKFSVCVIVMK